MEYLQWGPVVGKSTVPIELVNELIKKSDKEVSANHDLAGHLQDQYYYSDTARLWFQEKLKVFINDYYKSDVRFTLDLLWINHMKAGDYNPPHSHSKELSFVLFGDLPPSLAIEAYSSEAASELPGSLNFIYGDLAVSTYNVNHSFFPNKGDFFIFPALTTHYVTPFKSEGTRISISGNISIVR